MTAEGRPTRRLEADAESIIESVTDAFFALDKDWRFTYINRNGERLLGKEPDELLGQTIWDVYSLKGTQFEDTYRAVAETGVATSLTSYYPDHQRWYEVHAYPSFRGISVYFRDVSERMHVDGLLRKSERRYRQLFESIDEGFCIIELKFNSEGEPIDYLFLEANGAFEEQTGLSNPVGKTILELAPGIEKSWITIYGRIAETREPLRFELQSGALKRWFDAYAFPVDDPESRTVAILFSDVTDRKRIESDLRRSDRQKDEFLAMLAHELRNPLAPIGTAAQMLRQGDLGAQQIATAAAVISRQVDHMTRLVDDLLDVSRVTRGMVKLELVPVDLKVAIDNAIEQVRGLFESRNHRLNVHLANQAVWVCADRVRLVQVISNLLSNAAKYTPPKGDIHISTDVVDNHVEVVVRDNGIGIADELLPTIFDLFSQGERSADRAEGGLGLGLALVKKMVDLHGGTVSATSGGHGKGSEFKVSLARTSEPERAGGFELLERLGSAEGRPLKIMVVDDNEDAALMLAGLLGMCGYEAIVAHDATSALKLAERQKFHAFILDIGLPEIDGYALAKMLQERPQFSSAIYVALTGYSRDLAREQATEVRIDFHFMKPVNTSQLLAAIRGLAAPEIPASRARVAVRN
jgi:PAS domain S-box-containing protein